MNSNRFSEAKIATVCLMAAIGVFTFDLSVSLGVAGGVLYIVVVLFILWSRKSRTTILCAVGCSALTLLGYFLSPDGGET
jgi:hypothetical protein